jgi:hypothetical protein
VQVVHVASFETSVTGIVALKAFCVSNALEERLIAE